MFHLLAQMLFVCKGCEQIAAALEQIKGEGWSQFAERHGDGRRGAAFWFGPLPGRLRLAEKATTGVREA